MSLDKVKYRLSLNDIKVLKDKIDIIEYFSIIYSLDELDQAFSDYIDLIDSYENFCEKDNKNKLCYFCEFDICNTTLYKTCVMIHITLYNSK